MHAATHYSAHLSIRKVLNSYAPASTRGLCPRPRMLVNVCLQNQSYQTNLRRCAARAYGPEDHTRCSINKDPNPVGTIVCFRQNPRFSHARASLLYTGKTTRTQTCDRTASIMRSILNTFTSCRYTPTAPLMRGSWGRIQMNLALTIE